MTTELHDPSPATLFAGRHLALRSRGGWEYVSRTTERPAVGIVAITDDEQVLLVEQFRPPAGRTVFELPAGLAGDLPGGEDESLQVAAQRELLEETGYHASRWTQLASGYSSPGLADEQIVLFLAEGLSRPGTGGGDASEAILLHHVPLAGVFDWLRERACPIDLKLLAGLYAAQQHREQRTGAATPSPSGRGPG
jgi:ADP-ribose pyrophosphatase